MIWQGSTKFFFSAQMNKMYINAAIQWFASACDIYGIIQHGMHNENTDGSIPQNQKWKELKAKKRAANYTTSVSIYVLDFVLDFPNPLTIYLWKNCVLLS